MNRPRGTRATAADRLESAGLRLLEHGLTATACKDRPWILHAKLSRFLLLNPRAILSSGRELFPGWRKYACQTATFSVSFIRKSGAMRTSRRRFLCLRPGRKTPGDNLCVNRGSEPRLGGAQAFRPGRQSAPYTKHTGPSAMLPPLGILVEVSVSTVMARIGASTAAAGATSATRAIAYAGPASMTCPARFASAGVARRPGSSP